MGLVKEDGTLVEQLYYNSTGLCKSWDPSGGGSWNTHPDNAAYNIGCSVHGIPFGYLGMYHDPFTGKYHTHYREYDPVHARWLSEDPAGYADGLNLYNAYMGVNGIDPLGLEISKREMMEAYSDIFGYDDILLRAFIASGHSFDMGDVLGDWDVDRSWFTKGQPLDIEIEEDLDAVTAAFYLRKAFFQALGDSREMRKNVLSMKYGSNDPGAFKGSDSYFRAGEWAAELKQLEAIAAANMSVDAAAMAEAYFSIPAIMSEGADFVSTVAEVCNGNYYALAGLLPFVPSTVKMVDNATNLCRIGSKYDIGEYKALRDVAEKGLDAHHVGQKAAMKKFIPEYDIKTGPSILVPRQGHTHRGPRGIVSRKINGLNSAREILARDISELRRGYPDIPNSQLKKLIELNNSN